MNPDERRARLEACRASMLEDHAALRRYTAGSLRQMVKAGHPFAMVPDALVGPVQLELIVRHLDAAQVCGVVLVEAPLRVSWVCLARLDADDYAGHAHRWPLPATRIDLAGALVLQVDPIARIERRVAFALEGPSAHPLLADMPTA